MNDSSAGDEGRSASSEKGREEAEGWFRFGDEPKGDETTADASRPAPTAAPEPRDDAATSARGMESAADADEPARAVPAAARANAPAPARAPESEPEERIQPFVVSATPGGVDLDMKEAADAAVVTSVGGGRGFGLVGALTVMLALFGLGLFALTGPRAADAEGRGGSQLWLSDIDKATALAAAEGKPLIVHFTADWCPPCRAMRENVFESSVVQDRLAAHFVTVRVDLTTRGGPNDRIAAEFGVRSIPDLQVYHPDGWQMERFGYVSSAGEFLGALDRIGRD